MSTSPNNRNCLSLHDMEKYVKGGLDAKSLRSVELHLLECELCSEAVEGYREIPFTQSDLPPVPKAVVRIPLWKTMSIAASIFICAGIAYLTYHSLREQGTPLAENLREERRNDTLSLLTTPPQDMQDKDQLLNELISKDKEVNALMNEPVKPGMSSADPNNEDASLWIMPQRKMDAVAGLENHEPGLIVKVTYRDTFIHELKVTDYSAYYALEENEADKNRSIEARFENKDQEKKKDKTPDLEWVTTGDVLRKGLENFSKGNFTDAVKLFNVLISYEPQDVNALFYGAVCYKNLSRATDAISYLERVLANPNSSFYEEAEWELAQAYVQTKDFQKAEVLLEKILKANGFYAERSRDLLKRVKVKNKK